MRMAQIGKMMLRMIGCLALSIMIGALLMICAYALPVEPMYRHVQESIKTIEQEGKPVPMVSWSGDDTSVHTKLNPWSDHIMLMQAIYPASDSVVRDAMLNRRWLFAKGDVNTTDVLLRNLNGGKDGNAELIYQQLGYTDGTVDASSNSIIYPRYWHGYLTVLKPMLLVTNVGGVRVYNFYLQFVLMVTAIVLLYNRLGLIYTASFTLVLLTLNPITLVMVFQIDATVYIMLLAVILALWQNEWLWDNGLYPYFFLFIGILTAFFDFFTFPLVGFGIPWLVYCILNKRRLPGCDSMIGLFGHGACWLLGYAGMWSGKWLVSWLLTGYNTVYDAYLSIGHRVSHTDWLGETITPWDAVIQNCTVFFMDPLAFVILAIFCFFVYHIVITKRLVIQGRASATFLLMAALPFLWYIGLCNHSYISAGESYRHLVVTEFAALCLFIENLRDKDETEV